MTFEEVINNPELEKLANSVIGKYDFWIKKFDIYEDLYNLCLLGIWQGLPNYDPDSGVKLSTYLYGCMHRKVFPEIKERYLGSNGGKKDFLLSVDYLDQPFQAEGVEFSSPLGETLCSPEVQLDLNMDMHEALKKLGDREYKVLVGKVIYKIPHKNLQEEFGLSRPGIDRLLQKAKKEMRQHLSTMI